MKYLLNILKKPYDLLKDKTFRWKFILGCSLFCFLFLWIFEPFGLYRLNNLYEKIQLIGMYVAGTALFLILYFFIQDFIIKKYTIGNTILWIILSFLLMGVVNATIHEYLFNQGNLRWSTFVYFQWAIFSISIIPVSVFVLIHYNITLKKRLSMIYPLDTNISDNQENDMSVIVNSENKKEEKKISIGDLLYIKSVDNYIDVYFVQDSNVVHNLVRYSLSGVESDNADLKVLLRCHKSYIVNRRKIESVSGNAAGYRIKLQGCETLVPVSRKLNKELAELISE